MYRHPFTGKWKTGAVVNYKWRTPAVSCQSSGLIESWGTITGTEKANGTTMYVIDNYTLLFEDEIKSIRRVSRKKAA